MQRAHHLVRAEMEVEKTRQKTYYDYSSYGPTHSEGRQIVVFFLAVKKGEREKATIFYKEPFTLVDFFNSLIFRVCSKRVKKT